MKRREFIQRVYVGGIAFALPRYSFMQERGGWEHVAPVKNGIQSKVVSLHDSTVVSPSFSIDQNRAKELLRAALIRYSGKNTPADAIKSFFPKWHNNLRVGIKLNLASGEMPSHHFLATALAEDLVSAGLKPENVIIWERAEFSLDRAKMPVVNKAGAIKTIATDTEGFGYDESRKYKVHDIPVYITSIISKHTDYQINLGVLKHHWLTGVATALKNYYGAIPLMDNVRLTGIRNTVKIHWDYCDPYIPALNEIIESLSPTVLNICDGLLGIYNSGPLGPPQWVQNEILVSKDPVALDTLSLYRVERKRKEIGLPPLLYRAGYIRTAAKRNLGTNDPAAIEMIREEI